MTVEEEPEYVSDIIFRRPKSHQFSAEIAIGSAIAFFLSQTPRTGTQGTVLTGVMALLVVIPVLRFLVDTGRYTPAEEFLGYSVRPLELSTILGVVYLFQYVADQFLSSYTALRLIELTAILAVAATILYIVCFEFLFKTYRFSWGTLFYVKTLSVKQSISVPLDDPDALFDAFATQDSNLARLKAAFTVLLQALLMVTWGQTAFHLLKDSIPERDDDEEHLKTLQTYVEKNRNSDQLGNRIGLWFTFLLAALIVLPVFAIIAWGLSLVLASFGMMILVLVIMRVTKHIVGFTYIAFGALRYDQFVTTNKRAIALTAVYVAAVYLVIFAPA